MQRPSFFAKLAVQRPVTILVSLLAVLVVGFIAFQKIPIELLPSGFSPPYMGVWVPYNNANPQEIEQQIARPVEEELRTIPGLKKIETYSSRDGCWATLQFNQGVNMDLAYDQMRDRMERARAQLPDDFQRYFLRRFGRNDEPVIFLAISFRHPLDDPYYVIDHDVKRPIERLDGVANIDIYGAFEKAVEILIDQDKVKAYGVNLSSLISELRRDNFTMSSGWVNDAGKKYLVRSVGRFQSLEAIRQLPINQNNLTVGDIADVVYDVPKRDRIQRINGKPALKLEIFKESLANTVALSKKLRKVIREEIAPNPSLKDADIQILFDQGKLIRESIDNLISTALWGGIFAILILYFFLRRLRMTLIMLVAIPLSVLVSLTLVYFIGWTLNTITMMGLMISVGMVVDNAIVVLENIYRKRNEGLNSREASIWGTTEVSLAIVMATFTTIVVFLPMIFIDDPVGFFSFYMKRIGLPVIFALLASLVVALVLIPLATTRFISTRPAKELPVITRSREKYRKALVFVLRRRLDAVLVIVGIMVFTMGFLMPHTPKVDNQNGNISDFRLIFELPNNFTLEEADHYFKAVEDSIFAHAKEYDVKAVDTRIRKIRGFVRVFLNPASKQQWYTVLVKQMSHLLGIRRKEKMDREAVLADIKKRLPKKAGVTFRTSWRGAAQGSDEGTVSILLYGDDTSRLAELSKEVERRMRLLPNVYGVETDREAGSDEINVFVDREKARRNGINPNQVAFSLMYALRGINLPRFQANEKEVEMRIQVREEDRQNLEQLKNMKFVNRSGKSLPLSALARFSVDKGFGQITRENGKTFLQVKAHTRVKDLQKTSRQIDQIMKGFTLPVGYSWVKGTRFRRFRDQSASVSQALTLAVVFVFLLMGILFESFVLPLSVLVAIPLSFFGAYLALYITKTPQDIMAGIGIVILVGVVVNNAIVLIDMINRRRQEGLGRREAILDAGAHRFRPILMTSLTTIGGLIPMALGNASLIGIPYAPMGRAIIGGMISSTFLTLLAVPVLYTLFDDMSLYFKRVVLWAKNYRRILPES